VIGDQIRTTGRSYIANFDHAADEVRTGEKGFGIWSTGGLFVTDKIRGYSRSLYHGRPPEPRPAKMKAMFAPGVLKRN